MSSASDLGIEIGLNLTELELHRSLSVSMTLDDVDESGIFRNDHPVVLARGRGFPRISNSLPVPLVPGINHDSRVDPLKAWERTPKLPLFTPFQVLLKSVIWINKMYYVVCPGIQNTVEFYCMLRL